MGSADRPRVSVVIPSFEQGRFLEDALLSVLGQGYPDLEVIVLDGGSQDESVGILQRYDQQLAHWQSQPDGGQAAAINAGMRLSTGQVLCWLNSDDMLAPGALLRAARHLGDPTRPALVYGAALVFSEGTSGTAEYATCRPFDRELLRGTQYLVQPSTFWTRALWDRTGELDEELTFALDWEWFIRASAETDFLYRPDTQALYRRHDEQKTGSGGGRRRAELLQVVRRHGTPEWISAYDQAVELLARDPVPLRLARRLRLGESRGLRLANVHRAARGKPAVHPELVPAALAMLRE